MRSSTRAATWLAGWSSLLLSAGCSSVVGLSGLSVDECFDGCDAGAVADGGLDASTPDAQGTDTGTSSQDGTTRDGTTGSDGSGGNDAGPPSDGGTVDAVAADAPQDAGGWTDGPCPGTAGPTPVRVGAYCIDSTEVTNTDYAAFLAAKGSDTSGQPPQCQFNTSYTPSQGWPVSGSKASFPVVYVDWCDAYAFCAWSGKRLCGAIGGGPSSRASAADKNVSQWYAACSKDGALLFPYGNAYVSGDCNDSELHAQTLENVGSMSTCVGGFPGLFDMNGNAYEWEDACDVSSGPSDACLIRGGAFDFAGSTYGGCTTYFNDYSVLRSNTFNDTGFRCCGP